MVLVNLLLFLLSLFVLVKSADYATQYSSKISKAFRISEFIVSFFIVAVISTFPEASISLISAAGGNPELGLGTLLGSNVADLTLVFGIAALVSVKGVRVKSEILKEDFLYLALLLFPIFLGLDGYYSRVDGILLLLGGAFFYLKLAGDSKLLKRKTIQKRDKSFWKDLCLLLLSISILLVSASFTVKFGVDFANEIMVPTVLIGLTVISIGTCLPELLFSIKSIKKSHDELAVGDVLGTVVTDATIVLGAMMLISPFSFSQSVILVTGFGMLFAGLLAIGFITTGKTLTRREGMLLLAFYFMYLAVEFLVNGPI